MEEPENDDIEETVDTDMEEPENSDLEVVGEG